MLLYVTFFLNFSFTNSVLCINNTYQILCSFLGTNTYPIEAMLSLDRPRQPTKIHNANFKLPQFLCSHVTSICEALDWFAYSNWVFLSLARLFLANQMLSQKGNVSITELQTITSSTNEWLLHSKCVTWQCINNRASNYYYIIHHGRWLLDK